ncbi:MAG: peptidoglycan DD-metalloendopeptidase family protein [Bacteroidales bacterium]|nr:peptidoglycan DD-metalloendopeptidase family protein [Bacteroidales bacterium]
MPFRPKTVISILLILFLFSCKESVNDIIPFQQSPPADTTALHGTGQTTFMYGIPSDSFDLVNGMIKRNEMLSTILLRYGIKMEEIEMAVRNSASVFDVRKIRSGNNYTVFCRKDSIARAGYFVYEHDPTTCYVFSFSDSLNITPFRKEVKKVIRYASGTIETSLWDAMVLNGMHPVLVTGLSEIYAWSIDFFGLQKGDSFKVIYEEMSIDDKPLGVARIYGAAFTSYGTTIHAIPFIQDSSESYFDSQGNSLRKAFLKAPLQYSRVSSRFSASRLHPILRIRRPHHGVDYAAPVGTPVHAVGDGRVTQASYDSGSGRMVRIVHNSVYSTAYLHLSRFGAGIAPGVYVKQGDVIGYVGSSGLSTGPHLDFRFYMNGTPVDPLKVEAPPVEPVSPANLAAFEKTKTVVLSLLNTF